MATSFPQDPTLLFKHALNISRISEKHILSREAYINLIQAVRDSGNNTKVLTRLFTNKF